MSSREMPHFQDEDLLRLLDGELPDGEASQLRSHIEACWTCRTRLEEFEGAIGEYVRYREGALESLLPPPPEPWSDLQPKLSEVDRSLIPPRAPAAVRHTHWMRFRPAHWLAAAACLVIALFLIQRLERVPAVNAAELLRKAAVAESSSGARRRIQIKTRHRTFLRPAAITPAAASTSEAGEPRQLFAAAHFSWENPLSARSYAAWRELLPEKHDTVDTVDHDASAGGAVYIIKTSTLANPLRAASLTLRVRDLRPLREMLEFTSDTVEITDVPEASGTDVVERPAKSTPELPRIPPSVITPSNVPSPTRQELEVFSALHRIGADLGEPVEIHQSGSRLQVIGTGLTAGRKGQLEAALAGIAGVDVRFEEARANSRANSVPTERAATGTAPAQLRLQALLGSRESAEDFTNHALDASDAMIARVHALRALARAFHPDTEGNLTSQDRRLLTTLRDDHAAALSQHIAELERALQPVIAQPSKLPMADSLSSWQVAVEALFEAAQSFDDSLNAALAGSGVTTEDSGFQKLASTLERLRAQFAAYEKASR